MTCTLNEPSGDGDGSGKTADVNLTPIARGSIQLTKIYAAANRHSCSFASPADNKIVCEIDVLKLVCVDEEGAFGCRATKEVVSRTFDSKTEVVRLRELYCFLLPENMNDRVTYNDIG